MSKRKFVDVTPIIEEFKIRGVELNGCDPVVYGIHRGFAEAAKLLSKAPPADVAPVCYGETFIDERGLCRCSECGGQTSIVWRYCPHCGAKMGLNAPQTKTGYRAETQ